MAEQGLMLKIGADVVEVTKSLNQVEQEIKQLNQEIKKLSGQALVDANKRLDNLSETATRLKNVGRTGFDQFGVAINKIGASATGATPALNSLSQVARDLPFGFIAIQNNLPIVIDQFSALTKASGGVLPALKGLAASLVGPAGLSFAFGAAVAGLTALIQKYGSLGAAITELSSAQDSASVASRKFNSELAESIAGQNGEIQTLRNYSSILTDTAVSQQERINAYKLLKKEYPGVIQNMTQENALTAAGAALINSRTLSLIEYIKLKSKEAALIKLGEDATKKQLLAQKEGLDILQSQNTFLGSFINNLRGGFIPGIGGLNGLNKRLEAAGDNFISAGKDADFFNSELEKVQREILQFDPKIIGVEGIGKGTKDGVDKAVKELERYRAKVQEIIQSTRNQPINLDAFGILPNVDKLVKEFNNEVKKVDKFEIPVKLAIPKSVQDQLSRFQLPDGFRVLEEQTKRITSQFNDFLAPAINTVFGALENGQSIPKALSQAFKAMLVQISLTIAKAAILATILNAIFPGGAALGGKTVQGFGKIFGSLLGFGGVAAPSFGGLQAGGVAVTVTGSLTGRGTELVGVINSANGQIRRVG